MLELLGALIGIAAVIFALWVVFYAVGIVKKEFQVTNSKKGAKSVSKAQLKSMLLKLNNNKLFKISQPKDTDLFLQWKIIDKKWIEVLGPAWLNKNYYAWILLDEEKKMVKYNELITEKSFTSGTTGFHGEASFFRGIQLFRKERGYAWGVRSDFTIGEIYNYKFNPNDIKEVIRQIANDHGWSFGLVTTKSQASYKK